MEPADRGRTVSDTDYRTCREVGTYTLRLSTPNSCNDKHSSATYGCETTKKVIDN